MEGANMEGGRHAGHGWDWMSDLGYGQRDWERCGIEVSPCRVSRRVRFDLFLSCV